MEELYHQFMPLLKSRVKRYYAFGLEYDDIFQQASLLFIMVVYDYREIPAITFSHYIRKRIDWGLWMYYRDFLKQKVEILSGLNPKGKE